MNRSVPEVRAGDRPTGLIDTLQAGFNVVNHNAWLLIIPLALDFFLLWGPQPSLGPSFGRLAGELASPQLPASAAFAPGSEEARRGLVEMVERASQVNLLSLLALPAMGVPSFRASVAGEGTRIPLDSMTSVGAVVLACLVIGLTLATWFFGLLAQAVREGQAEVRRFVPDFAQTALWVIALFGLALVAVVGIGGPALVLLAAVSAAIPTAATVLEAILVGVVLWAFVYLFFTTDALYVSRVSPLVAIQRSVRVVRHNLWSALGLILLVVLISTGLTMLWQQVATNLRAPGVGLSIVGHSYISTGLAAASMTYYKERWERLRS